MSTELATADAPDLATMKRVGPIVELESFREKIIAIKTTADTLKVTSVDDKAGMKLARQTRLSIREIRLGFTEAHKTLKAESLKRCQDLDEGKRELLVLCDPLEEKLKALEEFAERETARQKQETAQMRSEELAPFGFDIRFVDLAEMPEEAYVTLFQSAKGAHEAKIVAAAKEKAQIETKAKQDDLRRTRDLALAPLVRFIRSSIPDTGTLEEEAFAALLSEGKAGLDAERAHNAKIEADNAKLKQQAKDAADALKKQAEDDAKEKDRLAKIEDAILGIREGETDVIRICKTAEDTRKEIEYVEAKKLTEEVFQERLAEAEEIKAEVLKSMRAILATRVEAERVEKELADARAAEQKKINDAIEEQEAQKKAPDREKLVKLADAVVTFPLPAMTTPAGQNALAEITLLFLALANRITQESEAL